MLKSNNMKNLHIHGLYTSYEESAWETWIDTNNAQAALEMFFNQEIEITDTYDVWIGDANGSWLSDGRKLDILYYYDVLEY